MKKNSELSGEVSTSGTENGSPLAPQICRVAVLDDEGEAEGEQQAVERIAPVHAADQQALDGKTDERREERRDEQRAPEAEIGPQRVGEIAADDQEPAVREVDDARQVEDERQADRHERVERADDQAVGDVEEGELEHR